MDLEVVEGTVPSRERHPRRFHPIFRVPWSSEILLMWTLRGRNWKQFLKTLYAAFSRHQVTGQSARLTFYFLLALFPLLLALTALLGLVLRSDNTLLQGIDGYLKAVAPESVTALISSTLRETTHRATGLKVWVGLLGSIWAASSAMVALIEALNVIYAVAEARKWWKRRLVAVLLTGGFLLLLVPALGLLVYGPKLSNWAVEQFGLGGAALAIWNAVRWVLIGGLLLTAFNLLYTYGPHLKPHRWRWLMPGTIAGLVLWLGVSIGFKIYLSHFNRYSATYGSLAAVVILMLWLYFTGIAVLAGAEINAHLSKAREKP